MRFGYVLLGIVTLTSLHVSSGQCNNGLEGVQNDDICCHIGCGTCGGRYCPERPGGNELCCTGPIRDSGIMCSTASAAPCIIDDVEDAFCSNGLRGVEADSVCCEAQCGTCGGEGCSQRPGGESSCCTPAIRQSGRVCIINSAAPCLITDEVPEEVCSNGVPGVQRDGFCCEAQCGTCGGPGCRDRPGGRSGCCTGRIEDNGIYCSDTPVAPCIIENDDTNC